jgi:hypothetical protein
MHLPSAYWRGSLIGICKALRVMFNIQDLNTKKKATWLDLLAGRRGVPYHSMNLTNDVWDQTFTRMELRQLLPQFICQTPSNVATKFVLELIK